MPDPKAKRYDRQLRIWGTHGQQRLENCSICLLNCGPTGSETLKNLVLGGIASFTIVDGGKVEPRDLGNNFLVSEASLGEPRAKVVTELLQELNESVSGSYVEEVPEVLLDNKPKFFSSFQLVIATQVRAERVGSGSRFGHVRHHGVGDGERRGGGGACGGGSSRKRQSCGFSGARAGCIGCYTLWGAPQLLHLLQLPAWLPPACRADGGHRLCSWIVRPCATRSGPARHSCSCVEQLVPPLPSHTVALLMANLQPAQPSHLPPTVRPPVTAPGSNCPPPRCARPTCSSWTPSAGRPACSCWWCGRTAWWGTCG